MNYTGSACLTGRGGMCEGSEDEDEGRDSSMFLMGSASRLMATSSLLISRTIECRYCGRTGRLCVRLDLQGAGRASLIVLVMYAVCRTAASLLRTTAIVECRCLTGTGAL